MAQIFLVEDEIDLSNLVERYLINEGHNVTKFLNGEDAIKHINDNVDLWILDIMLPGLVNGYDLIREIRKNNTLVPVVFTSARDEDIDRVLGLELGGDDYVSKPYSPRELMLRVKNLLSRTKQSQPKTNEIKCGVYTVIPETRTVLIDNKTIELTSKEYDLLDLLIKNQGQAFSREQILVSVWGNEYLGSDRVVDDLVRRLRGKMPKLRVETVYGFGYRLS